MPNLAVPKSKVSRVADEIQAWLSANPGAKESLRGIVEWWLMQQRFEEAWSTVEMALELLIQKGAVKQARLPDGGVVYSAAQSKKEDLAAY